LPTEDPVELASALQREAQVGSLVGYLQVFRHPLSVLQSAQALEKVAQDCVEDLAGDGIDYAEVRFAPEAHTRRGMTMDDAIEAVLAGFSRAKNLGITVGLICTALRDQPHSLAVAEAAGRWAGRGVVGFDLAGPEVGFPPDLHAAAVRHANNAGLGITIHAGEAAGVETITAALDVGATRIGHGVRIIDDLDFTTDPPRPGPVAERLIAQGTLLEISPTSNVHTGFVPTFADHPIDRIRRAGVSVSVNTDNRLFSGLTLSSELDAMTRFHGWGPDEISQSFEAARGAVFV
jgi:adenosine deaminase